MSMLARFRKPGGFLQLLALIETCDEQKRRNLLDLIGAEDPGWAHLVKIKALSFERIMSWPVETLMEITPHLPDKILVSVYQMCDQAKREKWLKSLPGIKSKEIQNLSAESPVNYFEQGPTAIKLIQIVRDQISKGQIRFAQFDPTLEIDQQIAA